MTRLLLNALNLISIALGIVCGIVLTIFGIIGAYLLLGWLGAFIAFGMFPVLAMGGAIIVVWIADGQFPWLLLIIQVVMFGCFALQVRLGGE